MAEGEEKKEAPPPTGLPADWQRRFVESINEKIPNAGRCPRCATGAAGETTMVIGEDAVTPIIWNGSLNLGGTSYPQAMLVCRNCGYTTYHNLVVLGIVPPAKKPEGDHE